MSIFIIRVTLHGKDHSHQDYTRLHNAMGNSNYSRIITGFNGVRYHLPTAEYTITGINTADSIYIHVKSIANIIDINNGVLVTRVPTLNSQDIQWGGLKPV